MRTQEFDDVVRKIGGVRKSIHNGSLRLYKTNVFEVRNGCRHYSTEAEINWRGNDVVHAVDFG
ncbi:hypothetical protein D3C85_1673330 [compost metagenome]